MDIGGISEKERRRSGLLPLLLSAALLLGGCSVPDARLPYASMTHMRTEIVGVEEAKGLARSLSALAQGMEDWNGLAFAVEQSLAWLAAKPGDETALVLPGDDAPGVTWEDLRTGLRRLLEILPYLDMNPDLLAEEFTWLRLSPSFGFTGYYEPTLLADWSEGPIYRIPLYALPPDLQAGTRYHDRHAIDRDKVLAGRDLEIAWVMDEVDVFFLHIQGSGRLVFPDG
jgi:membrane-bound lytic murein transglycosylase A